MRIELAPAMQGSHLLLFLSYALATLLLGVALHYLVERPFLRWRDRWVGLSSATRELAAA